MGEVYRALDPRLNRDVALKFLRPEFSRDAERLQRFVREAQTLAALNHPHIAQLYGVEDALEDGVAVRALVMEFVDGEDLAARLRRGPVPVEDAWEIAHQIAAALEAAHDQGIVHRDLKPANIKIRPDGSVKVLDLGLAKAMDQGSGIGDQGSGDLANSPTITSPAMTVRGVILGTAAYMSPEQARGKAVDKRADIWAFGVVLYEMLTGRAAFRGETTTDLLAAVITREPEWQALPHGLSPAIRRLLRRCLEKDVRLRLRDIGEARIALAHPEAADVTTTDRDAQSVRPRFVSLLPWAVAAIAIAAGTAAWTMKPATSAPLRKIEISLPTSGAGSTVALSPDGKRIAYRTGDRIVVNDLERFTSIDLAASRAAQRGVVFWSPDSAFVGYNDADAKLWIVPAGGGSPRELCKVPESGQMLGAAWHTDNAITIAVWRGGLYRVPSAGGSPALIVKVDPQKEVDFHNVVPLPDGRVLVATHLPAAGPIQGRFVSEVIDGTTRGPALGDDVIPVAHLPSGHLLVERLGANVGLWALPYSGTFPIRIEDGFLVAPGAGQESASNDGSLLYSLASTTPHEHEMVWVDRQGRTVGQIGSAQPALVGVSLSPDEQSVAFLAQVGDTSEVWVRDIATGQDTRLTFDTVNQLRPNWFPDGRKVIYREDQRITAERIVSRVADGSAEPVELLTGLNPDVSPDGRFLVYLLGQQGSPRLRVAPLSAEGIPGAGAPFFKRTPEPAVSNARLSPDGRLLAYGEQQPGGSTEIFITKFPSGEGRWQVANGAAPVWVSNTELVFMTGSSAGRNVMQSVTLSGGDAMFVSAAKKLFDFGADIVTDATWGPVFDVARDGRFLMIRERPTGRPLADSRWVLVQNWLTEFAAKEGSR
jgi:eukaryotic-like serine/threonine-protein kinase